MSLVGGFRRSSLGMIAVLVALAALSLSARDAQITFAAEETASSETKSDGEGKSSGDKSESNEEKEAPAKDRKEEKVTEEVDREVEVEPADDAEEAAEVSAEPKKEAEPPKKEKRTIGATATVLEKQSNLLLRARVDTGAKSCSMHVEELSIDDEEEKWIDNIGKVVHFKVKNLNGESHYLDARIDGYVIIKTSGARERRYKVPLTLRWKGVEKTVMVTLNDRNGMEYPLLLGRNFLRGDFIVDVDVDDDD